jgi:hypothetical protein
MGQAGGGCVLGGVFGGEAFSVYELFLNQTTHLLEMFLFQFSLSLSPPQSSSWPSLAEGAFSVVYLVEDCETGELLAAKVYKLGKGRVMMMIMVMIMIVVSR